MPQEYILSDLSGGINPSQAPDKLTDREALQAQNCRLDDFGNLASAFGSTLQNSTLVDTTTNSNVHSLFIDQAVGVVAGVGQDAFAGLNIGSLTDLSKGANAAQAKMSFGNAPTRIFFDSGSGVAEFYDSSIGAVLSVDWAPPSAGSGASTTDTAGTGGTQTRSGGSAWSNASAITGNSSFATVALSVSGPSFSQYLKANGFGFSLSTSTLQGIQVSATCKLSGPENNGYVSVYATLLRNGVAVGTTLFASIFQSSNVTLTWGNSTYLWGTTLTAADLNSATFGVLFSATISTNASLTPVTFEIQNVTVTASQVGAGFVAGTAGSGTNLAGTYTYAITFSGSGCESDASSPSLAVSLGAAAGTITSIPTGDARTTGRNVYRAGGLLGPTFYLVGSISDNVSTTYYDNQSDLAALTEGVILSGDVAGDQPASRFGSQTGKYPCFHLQRVFWANANSNTLVWSLPGNAFGYPADNELPVGDSKPITGLVSKWGCLIIYKTDSIWILSGTDESNFTLAKSESTVGCNSPFTIAPIANGIAFGNNAGLWVFNGATSSKLTPKLDLLFRGQPRNGLPAIESLNATVYGNHCAVATPTDYWFACAASGTTSNNLLFVISLLNGSIVTRSIDVLSLAVDQTTGFVYGGLGDGQIVKIDDYTALLDSQGAFPFVFQSKYTDCGARGSNIQIWGFEIFGNLNGQTLTPTVSYDNGVTSETLATISNTGLGRIQRSCESANARKAQNVSISLTGNLVANIVEITHIKFYYDILPGRSRTGQ
jgi:hypothetical protein